MCSNNINNHDNHYNVLTCGDTCRHGRAGARPSRPHLGFEFRETADGWCENAIHRRFFVHFMINAMIIMV